MQALDREDTAFVRDLVYRRAAIRLDDDKEYLITSRLEQLVHGGLTASVKGLVAEARQGRQDAATKIVEAITTHETLFFRDQEPFEALRTHILPPLLAPGRPAPKLTFWSAACSSGQEPYSLAMMFLEHFPRLVDAGLRIIGTDLSAQILAKAREARYGQLEVNRGLPASYLVKYFERLPGAWQLKPEVRRLVELKQQNLLEPWGLPARPDVVFMRNVLIYFDAATKRALLERVRAELGPGGVLFLGAAETTLGVHDGWERVPAGKTAWYRVKGTRT